MKLENRLTIVYFLGLVILLGFKIVDMNWLVVPAVLIGIIMAIVTNLKVRQPGKEPSCPTEIEQ